MRQLRPVPELPVCDLECRFPCVKVSGVFVRDEFIVSLFSDVDGQPFALEFDRLRVARNLNAPPVLFPRGGLDVEKLAARV